MNHADLTQKLRQWTDEFSALRAPIAVSPEYLHFLAARLVDAGLLQDDPDVVRMRSFDGQSFKRIRITGWNDQIKRFTYAGADSESFGLVPVNDIHREDMPKLVKIKDRLDAVG